MVIKREFLRTVKPEEPKFYVIEKKLISPFFVCFA